MKRRAPAVISILIPVLVTILIAVTLTGCLARTSASTGPAPATPQAAWARGTYVPTLPISHPPFGEFNASWMQRLDQPYIYMEQFGTYTATADHIPAVLREMRAQGLEPSGAPFCLFYDDPAQTPVNELYSRACIPIDSARSPTTPLRYDVLPSRTVAYAIISGHYDEAPRAYPHIIDYMRSKSWAIDGPIREIYVVQPGAARTPADLVCEIQIPVTRAD
jgi:effector-binding domain-containing protein